MDERRARSYLGQDLDELEAHADGFVGPVKLQVCGPWTAAAALQLPRGEPVLNDPGGGPRPGGLAHRGPAAARPRPAHPAPGRGARAPAGRAVAAGGARRRRPLLVRCHHGRAGQGDRRRGRAERPGRRGGRPRRRALLRGPAAGGAGPPAPARPASRSTSPCSARTWTTSSARPSSRGSSCSPAWCRRSAGGRALDVGGRGYGRAGPAAVAAARPRPAAARRPGGRHPHLRAGRGVPARMPAPH